MSVRSASPALAAALLFGASTPLAKLLIGDVAPLLLAGLLYLGSGLGMTLLLALRWARERAAGQTQTHLEVPRKEIPWLLGAIAFGGMLGPALLVLGLTQTSGASASLLLNVEGVLTAVIAWLVFKENADRQIVLGMVAIVAGGVLLSWEPGGAALSTGALFILGACLCWGIDNNLTRKVSTNDAMLVAGLKGLVAGACNTALALANGASLPTLPTVGASLLLGFFGYGLSLTTVRGWTSGTWNGAHRRLFLGRAVVRRSHLACHLAKRARPAVLGGGSADGTRRLAARAGAALARTQPRTARPLSPSSSRRASPARPRLRLEQRRAACTPASA